LHRARFSRRFDEWGIRIVTLKRGAVLIAAGLVSACGGGGGGGQDPQPVRTTMQGPGTTVTYGASSAAAKFDAILGVTDSGIDAAGSGSTVRITTDASGIITDLTIGTNTANVGFNKGDQPFGTPGTAIPSNAEVLRELTAGLQEIFSGGAGSYGFAFVDLSYSMYGAWAINDSNTGTNGRVGVIAFGVQTQAASMPTGSATYNGQALGMGMTGASAFAFTGDAQVVARFGDNKVDTTFSNLVTRDLNTNASGTLPTLSGTGSIVSTPTGNAYSGSLTGVGFIGAVDGNFYGPNAEETAGVFQAEGGGTTVIGSYGAKKQ